MSAVCRIPDRCGTRANILSLTFAPRPQSQRMAILISPTASQLPYRGSFIQYGFTMKTVLHPLLFAAMLMATQALVAARSQVGADGPAFEHLYRAGQSAMAAGQFDEALADFKQLRTLDPSVAEVHATLGALYFKTGEFNQAIEEIHTARKLKSGLAGLDTLLALSLAESGKYKESLAGLEKSFHTSSDPALKRQAGMELAHVYTSLGMDRKAVEVALQLRDDYKNDPEVLYNVGKILGNSAYMTMQELFHGAAGSLWSRLAEAEAFESQGSATDAIHSYESVLALDPQRPNIHYRMGRTYLTHWKSSYNAADLASAKSEFENELQVSPGNANAAYELAGLRAKDGDKAGAQQLYESAIQAYPDFEEAEVGLGSVLVDQGKPSLAVPHFQRAAAIRPNDEVAWYRLSQAERRLGDTQAQKQALARFQVLHTRSAAALNSALTPQGLDVVTPQQLSKEDQSN